MKSKLLFATLLLVLLSTSVITPYAAGPGPSDGVETGVPPDKAEPEAGIQGEGEAPADRLAGGIIEGVSSDYAWSQTTGSYRPITGGTVHGSGVLDDNNYNAVGIGFEFTYNGAAYTQVGINANGFVRMGGNAFTGYCSAAPISNADVTNCKNLVAALGMDLRGNTNGELRSETLGSAPDRVFVVQWKDFRHYSAGLDGEHYYFQVRLHETSNKVEFAYGEFLKDLNPRAAQVGIKGNSNADFNNRWGTSGWTNTVAGTLSTHTVALAQAFVPPAGLAWDWAPAQPHPALDTSYKTAPARVAIGDPLAYTVHIVNSGAAPANAATLVDPIPVGTTYNGDVTCTSGTCGYNGGLNQVEWAGVVGMGAEVTVSFSVGTAGLPCGATLVNQATIDDPNLVGDPVVKTASSAAIMGTPAALEGFEAGVPPAGWAETITADPGTDPDWSQVAAGTYPTVSPHGGAAMAQFNSHNAAEGASSRLWTGALDLSGYAAPQVVFWMSHDAGYPADADRVQIQVSADGIQWTDVGEPVQRYDASCTTPCWKEHGVVLSGYGLSTVHIGFLGISGYGGNVYLDDTALVEGWYPCPWLALGPDGARASCPGGVVSYGLTLTNMNPQGDTFDITAAGNTWTTTVNPALLVLGPGAAGQVMVTVEVPQGAAGGTTDTANLTATGQGGGLSDGATLVTTAAAPGMWAQIATEPNGGRMDNVVAGWNGYVWSITGHGFDANVRRYDPASNSWTVVGTPPPFGVNYAHSGCESGAQVYMYGDTNTAGFAGLWAYDMQAGTWTNIPPNGDAPPSTGIWAPAWVSDEQTGLCYLTGGATQPGGGDLATVYVFDPATSTWLPHLPDLVTARDMHAGWIFTRPADGHRLLCVAGGEDAVSTPLSSTQCYDLTVGAWGAENADLGPLPATWWGMGYQQKVLGGSQQQLWLVDGVYNGAVTAVSAYFDVVTGSWVAGQAPPTSAVYRTAVARAQNELYVVGGSTGGFDTTGLADRHFQCAVSNPVWVANIALKYRARSRPGSPVDVTGAIRIVDSLGSGVRSATVVVDWTLPDSTVVSRSGQTSRKGLATFKIRSTLTGLYQICVTNVTKEGYDYEPWRNVETCDTVTVP